MSRAQQRGNVFKTARACAREVQAWDDLDHAAQTYFDRYPNHPPDPFYWSRRETFREARALLSGDDWATRLFMSLDQPHLYSLRHHHLDLPKGAADPELLYDPSVRDQWKAALKVHLEPPYRWNLEAGERAIHAHVIGPRPVKLRHLAPSEVIKPFEFDDAVRVVAYVLKPPAAYAPRNLAVRWRAERNATGNLPRLSGPVGIPNTLTYMRRSHGLN